MHISGLPRRLFWAGYPFLARSPQGTQGLRESPTLKGWNKLAMEQYSSAGALEELEAAGPFFWAPDSLVGTVGTEEAGGAKDKAFSLAAEGP